MEKRDFFQVAAVGTVFNIIADFAVASVVIENPSDMWLYLSTLDMYIGPRTNGNRFNLTHPTNSFTITCVNAPTGGAPSAIAGGPIVVTTYDGPISDLAGIPYDLIPTLGSLITAINTLNTTMTGVNNRLDILGAGIIPNTLTVTVTLTLGLGPVSLVAAVAGLRHIPLYFKFGASLEVVTVNPIVQELRCELFHGPGGGPFTGFHTMSISPDHPDDIDNFFPYGVQIPAVNEELQAQIFVNGNTDTSCYLEMIYYDAP